MAKQSKQSHAAATPPSRGLANAECALAVLLILGVLGCIQALPAYEFVFKVPVEIGEIAVDNECNLEPEVETLCQRCAKLTKSNIVYPMCCEGREEAREWCGQYLTFGRFE